jgi:hypothetical protein
VLSSYFVAGGQSSAVKGVVAISFILGAVALPLMSGVKVGPGDCALCERLDPLDIKMPLTQIANIAKVFVRGRISVIFNQMMTP